MITSDGWVSWALREPGPASKVNGGTNGLLGLAWHSAEGFEAGMKSVLNGPRRASWHFSNMLDGRLKQHYPVFAQTWTSGSNTPNNNAPGTESEGMAGTPLNDLQTANVVRLVKEFEAYTGQQATRDLDAWSKAGLVLVEHRECVRWGSASTACPSDRYDWPRILAALEDDMATQQEIEQAKLRNAIIRTLLREDYQFAERDKDPQTGERIVEVLSGKDTDSQLLIRLR